MKKNKVIYLFIIVCLSFLSSCRHVEYVAVPEVRYTHTVDTVHDSVDRWHTHYEFLQGDTFRTVDTFYRFVYHVERATDTLTEHVPVPVVDTASLNALQRELDTTARAARRRVWWIVALAVALAGIVGWRIYRHFVPNPIWRNISTD